MMYESVPLYPEMRPGRGGQSCVRVPVFGGGGGPAGLPDESCCRRVWIENPCRPGDFAEVLLGVDDCGNLTVCVRRDGERHSCGCRPPRPQRPCLPPPCPPPQPRCDRRRGRLYGSW